MAAAIETLRSCREAHVIVLRTGSPRPLAVLVNRQAVVTGDHQPLAIRTIREAVYMDENDRGLRVRSMSGPTRNEQRHRDLPRPFEKRHSHHSVRTLARARAVGLGLT